MNGDPFEIIEDDRFRLTPARLRVQGHTQGKMHDLCDSEMYVMDPGTSQWVRLFPNKTFVRDGGNLRWVNITCGFDANFDDMCVASAGTSCIGQVTDPDAGSGDGRGSQGQPFSLITGYPEGYDMPDAGRGGFGVYAVARTNMITSPVGLSLQRPILNLEESYDGHGRSANNFLAGKYDNPSKVNSSTFGRGAAVTETVYELPSSTGFYELVYAAYSAVSIDVYFNGARVATTCGKVPKMTRSLLQFYVDPVLSEGDSRVMIRVRGEEGCSWAISVLDVQDKPTFDRINNSDPEDYADIIENLFSDDDFVKERYLGTPLFPAPCHGTVGNLSPENNLWKFRNRVEAQNYFEYYHYIGNIAGRVVIDYTTWATSDKIEVFYDGKRLATSNEYVDGEGYVEFMYDPVEGVHDIMIRISTLEGKRGDDLSSWYYTVYCPDVRGHRRDPWLCACLEDGAFNCEDNLTLSMGHPASEDNFLLDNGVVRGVFKVEVFNISHETTVKVFNSDGTLITEKTSLSSMVLEAFNFNDVTGQVYKEIYVRVETTLGGSYSYVVYCPELLIDIELEEKETGPEISIADLSMTSGNTENLVITLNKAVSTDTSVRLYTQDATAIDGVDYCGIDKVVVIPTGQTKALVPLLAAPCGGVVPPPTVPEWKDARIKKISEVATLTSKDAQAGVFIGRQKFDSSNFEIGYANQSISTEKVEFDTSTGAIRSAGTGKYVTAPDAEGVKDWRLTLVSGALDTKTNVGSWTTQNIIANCISNAGTGSSRSASVKIEFRYSDGNILSSVVELLAKSKSNPNTGGGGGCIVWGANTEVGDMQTLVEHVKAGDILKGSFIEGLPDSTTTGEDYLSWFAQQQDFKIEDVDVKVVDVWIDSYSEYFLFNGILGLTYEHPILTLRNGDVQWRRASDVDITDQIFSTKGFIDIESIELIEDDISTINYNVESSDTYFVEGILLHNIDNQVKK